MSELTGPDKVVKIDLINPTHPQIIKADSNKASEIYLPTDKKKKEISLFHPKPQHQANNSVYNLYTIIII